MIRKKRHFARPKKIYEKSRIEEENVFVEKYGLKNKKEIWKTLAKVNYYRLRAKSLARAPREEQEVLFNKLKYLGLNVNSISEVLALQVEDLLKRRLSTVVWSLGLANTAKHARQMIAHKRIFISGNAMNIPGYLVPVSLEKQITIKPLKKKIVPQEEPVEQSGEEIIPESNY